MSYCPDAKKATVDYSFANKKGRYISDRTPIEVVTTHEGNNFTGGQCKCMIYIVAATVVQSGREPYEVSKAMIGEILGFKTSKTLQSQVFVGGDPNRYVANLSTLCRGFTLSGFGCRDRYDWYAVYNDVSLALDFEFTNIKIATTSPQILDNCGSPPSGRCTIKVMHNQQNIFTISGSTPCNFNVSCDEECPPGTIRCEQPGYPGYCCLPCEPIATNIKGIANIVKQLNKDKVSRG